MTFIGKPERVTQICVIALFRDELSYRYFSDMEAKLAKARLLKQGMMQELLTGRIRLV